MRTIHEPLGIVRPRAGVVRPSGRTVPKPVRMTRSAGRAARKRTGAVAEWLWMLKARVGTFRRRGRIFLVHGRRVRTGLAAGGVSSYQSSGIGGMSAKPHWRRASTILPRWWTSWSVR